MTFKQYGTLLIKRWRLIAMCFLLVGAGASVGTWLITPLYQSSALVQVAVGSDPVYTGLLASEQLVQTEAVLATSGSVLREVASHYKALTVGQLSKEVTAIARINTQLFEIDVLDPSSTRAAALANDIAATLIKQQLQLIQQGAARIDLLIVQTASPSLRPAQPNKLLNISAGLLVGLLLGLVLGVLFEQLDTRVRTPEVLAQLLDWPVLGTIWQAGSKEEVVNPTGHNANVESYRILRTNIGFSAIDKSLHTLVVTSPLPRDGKSVVAANLAIFMAKAGKNTLLIDANLRHPGLREVFGIPADTMGLSNAILAFSISNTANQPTYYQFPTARSVSSSTTPTIHKSSLDSFVHATDIPNLCIMPSGPLPPNPTELLDSKAMQHLFKALANCGAEAVIFDSPPLLGLSDASILASNVDGTLVVTDITRAKKGSLKQMKGVLAQAGANVLGCVSNKQHHSRNDTNYSYYYSADKRNGLVNRSKKNGNLSPVLPVTPDILKQPETESQLDSLDNRKK